MNPPLWKSLPTKTHVYESLYALNRGFEIPLLSLARLEQLGLFRLEHLNAFKASLEHTRAEANTEIMETLQEYEQDETVRFDQTLQRWEKQLKDPDDVFFAARARKEEIREQIKDLQGGLDRLKSKRKKKRPR